MSLLAVCRYAARRETLHLRAFQTGRHGTTKTSGSFRGGNSVIFCDTPLTRVFRTNAPTHLKNGGNVNNSRQSLLRGFQQVGAEW